MGAQLKSCKACGRDVSLAATACPHCGHPMPEDQPVTNFLIALPYNLCRLSVLGISLWLIYSFIDVTGQVAGPTGEITTGAVLGLTIGGVGLLIWWAIIAIPLMVLGWIFKPRQRAR